MKRMVLLMVVFAIAMPVNAETEYANDYAWQQNVVGGGSMADVWKKARTLQGALVDNYGDVKGVIQVKVGKANKKGQISVAGTLIGLDGKKKSTKRSTETVIGSSATTTLMVKDGTVARVAIDANGVSGSWNGYRIVRAAIGGEFWKTANFNLKDTPDGLVYNRVEWGVWAWPRNEPVEMRGRKWFCEKAGRVTWLGHCCFILDGGSSCLCCTDCCGWGEASQIVNFNGLRLSYTMNTGVFKGSFNLYLSRYDDLSGMDQKGPKKTVSVRGMMVDGIGYGVATLRGYESWPVIIR